jgi:hypothetical protein
MFKTLLLPVPKNLRVLKEMYGINSFTSLHISLGRKYIICAVVLRLLLHFGKCCTLLISVEDEH